MPASRSSTWGSTSARSSRRSSAGISGSASAGTSASARRASAWCSALVQYVWAAEASRRQPGCTAAPAESPAAAAALRQSAMRWGAPQRWRCSCSLGARDRALGVVTVTRDPGGRRRRLPAARRHGGVSSPGCSSIGGWTPEERKRLLRRSACSSSRRPLFWSVFEQAGSTLNLFADRSTRNAILGWSVPEQLVPVGERALHHRVRAGVRLALGDAGHRASRPSPTKFAFGLHRRRPRLRRSRPGGAWPRATARRSARCWLIGDLPDSHVARTVPQPGRPELDDQARAGAHRRPDDGRLVPRRLGRQLHRRAGSPASTNRCRCRVCSAPSRRSPIVRGRAAARASSRPLRHG